MEKQNSERLERKSFEKVSSDVSEQHRRVSVITQKKLLADFAKVIGDEKKPKHSANHSIITQTL